MADATLVTVEELASKSYDEWDDAEKREAQGALDILSDDARYYGSDAWTAPENTPQSVKNRIIIAARRYMKNYEALVNSKSGDESVSMADLDEEMGTPYFTEEERRILAGIKGAIRQSLVSIPTVAWNHEYTPQPLRSRGVKQTPDDFTWGDFFDETPFDV